MTSQQLINEKMQFLTDKYHPLIESFIKSKTPNKVIYLKYDDFILDSDLFNPNQILFNWLAEISKPYSQYLPYKYEEAALADGFFNISGEKHHFNSVRFNLITIDFNNNFVLSCQ